VTLDTRPKLKYNYTMNLFLRAAKSLFPYVLSVLVGMAALGFFGVGLQGAVWAVFVLGFFCLAAEAYAHQ
jgi:hypothetical protein